jgi:hypothetical protein
MNIWRTDPGDCIVCGAAHCACTGDDGPTVIEQLPATATARTRARSVDPTPPSGPFNTGTYRRGKTDRTTTKKG